MVACAGVQQGVMRLLRDMIGLGLSAGLLGVGVGGADPTFVAADSATRLEPDYDTAVYIPRDRNTADLYFSTIAGIGQPGMSMRGASGSVLHVHMFLKPRAGRTPIDFDASNITVTHYVLAKGAVGVYGGAGFMLPSGTPGDSDFGGRARGVTLRPMARTAGFADRLGWNELSGKLSAERDDARAAEIAAFLAAVQNMHDLVPLEDEPERDDADE